MAAYGTFGLVVPPNRKGVPGASQTAPTPLAGGPAELLRLTLARALPGVSALVLFVHHAHSRGKLCIFMGPRFRLRRIKLAGLAVRMNHHAVNADPNGGVAGSLEVNHRDGPFNRLQVSVSAGHCYSLRPTVWPPYAATSLPMDLAA